MKENDQRRRLALISARSENIWSLLKISFSYKIISNENLSYIEIFANNNCRKLTREYFFESKYQIDLYRAEKVYIGILSRNDVFRIEIDFNEKYPFWLSYFRGRISSQNDKKSVHLKSCIIIFARWETVILPFSTGRGYRLSKKYHVNEKSLT